MLSATVIWTRLWLATQADCTAAHIYRRNTQRFSTYMAGFGLIFDGWVDSLSLVKENSSQCPIYLSESPSLRLAAHGVAMYFSELPTPTVASIFGITLSLSPEIHASTDDTLQY